MDDGIQTSGQLIAAMGNAVATVSKERREVTVGPVFGPGVHEAEEWARSNVDVRGSEVGMEVVFHRVGGSYSLRFFRMGEISDEQFCRIIEKRFTKERPLTAYGDGWTWRASMIAPDWARLGRVHPTPGNQAVGGPNVYVRKRDFTLIEFVGHPAFTHEGPERRAWEELADALLRLAENFDV